MSEPLPNAKDRAPGPRWLTGFPFYFACAVLGSYTLMPALAFVSVLFDIGRTPLLDSVVSGSLPVYILYGAGSVLSFFLLCGVWPRLWIWVAGFKDNQRTRKMSSIIVVATSIVIVSAAFFRLDVGIQSLAHGYVRFNTYGILPDALEELRQSAAASQHDLDPDHTSLHFGSFSHEGLTTTYLWATQDRKGGDELAWLACERSAAGGWTYTPLAESPFK